jgi:hypothetical protein
VDGVTLADLVARRDALEAEIAAAKKREREDWNGALWNCENALTEWLRGHSIECSRRSRKNEETWDIGHGALTVTFVEDEPGYGRGLRMVSGRTLTLEWSEVPDPERFLAIVAVLMGEKG